VKSSLGPNGGRYINCSFENIRGFIESPILRVFINVDSEFHGSFNISDCFFKNITYNDTDEGGLYYNVSVEYNYDYMFTGNTLIDLSGFRASIYFCNMYFTSFNFSNNSFSNIKSKDNGGVFHIYYYFYFLKGNFYFFYFFYSNFRFLLFY
jgi:hypothetical protein